MERRSKNRQRDALCLRVSFACVLWGIVTVVVVWVLFVFSCAGVIWAIDSPTTRSAFWETAAKTHVSKVRIPPSVLGTAPDGQISVTDTIGRDGLQSFSMAPQSFCTDPTMIAETCLRQQQHCKTGTLGIQISDATSQAPEGCKTLWFSGFHEGATSRCASRGMRMEYAASLASAKRFAKDVLQPVLILGRLGLESTEDMSALREWAYEQGAILVVVDRLSIQDNIARWHASDKTIGNEHLMGPYLRMDIPWIIEKYKLFELPGICDRHVLYTDSDSLFVNPIQHQHMDGLKNLIRNDRISWLRPPFLLYGREGLIDGRRPRNTGVMLIDVPRFAKELPSIIRFRDIHPRPSIFNAFDQGILNHYLEQSYYAELGRRMLPLQWNWKIYWKLEPYSLSDLFVIHFHGPKVKQGAENMARCDLDLSTTTPSPYTGMIERGICCNLGTTASAVLKLFRSLVPSEAEVC